MDVVFFFHSEFRACLHAQSGQKTNAVASFVCFKRHLFGWGVETPPGTNRREKGRGKREEGKEKSEEGWMQGYTHITMGLVG